MVTIGEILEKKGHAVISIAPEASVFEAIRLMAEHHVGAVVVMEGARLVGILTERDYSRKVVLMGRSSRDTHVRDIMTKRVLYVRPDDRLNGCMALMTAHRVRHLPVLEDERVVGLVSIGDLVKSRIDELTFEVDILERYIRGEYPG